MFKQLREFHRKDRVEYPYEAQEQMVAALQQEVLQKYEEAGGDAAHAADGDADMGGAGDGGGGGAMMMMPEPQGIFADLGAGAGADAMEQ